MAFSSFLDHQASAKSSQWGLKARSRRVSARLSLEQLEARLVMATLDVTGGALSYTAAAGVANNVILSTTPTTLALSDSAETIVLTPNAQAAGFTVDGTGHVVMGPEANVNTISIDTGDGADTIQDQSSIKPVTISPTSGNPTPQTVSLGNSTDGVQDITSTVTIGNANGTTTLNIDDSTNSVSSRFVTDNGTTISGLTPSTVSINPGALTTLNIQGGSVGNTFVFSGTAAPTTNLSTGTGVDSTFVQQLNLGAALSIQGQSGNDGVAISSAGILSPILGHVDVQNAGLGNTTNLVIDDSNDITARNLQLSGTQATGFNASVLITYPGPIGNFTVDGGSGGNTFTVANTIPGQTNTFNTGTGADTVLLEGTAAGSVDNINGESGSDQVAIGNAGLTSAILGASVNITNGSFTHVTVNDSNDATGQVATIGTTQLSGLTAGPINYALNSGSRLDVEGGNGGNSFNVSNAGANVYPTFITSGTGDDTFAFTDGASLAGGTIDGGAGSDTLDDHLYTTPVVVDLNSNPQTATGTNGTLNIENVIGGSGGNTLMAPAGVASTLTGGPDDDEFIIPANAGNAIVNGNGGTDDLMISGAGAADSFTTSSNGSGRIETVVMGSSATHTVDAGGINSLELNGGPGDTTATLDFSGGNPIPAGSVTYTGGGGAGNSLILENNVPGAAPYSFTNEVYNATGPGAGDISLDGSVVNFSGLSPVIDSVAALNATFNAPAAGNEIGITSDASVNGFAGTLIASSESPAGFESYALANKTNVTVNSVVPSDTSVTVDDPVLGALLGSLAINTGSGDDTVQLLHTPTGAPIAVNLGGGNDTFGVDAADLGGPVSVDGGTATNVLTYDAGNTTTAQTAATLQSGTFPTVTYANFAKINVNNILDLPLVNTPTVITTQEGAAFSGAVGSFSVSNPAPIPNQVNPTPVASDFVASIDWGDGSANSIGTIVANGTGGFDVLGNHTYAAASTPSITVSVIHNASTTVGPITTLMTNGGSTTSIASSATVNDAPLNAVSAPILATEGAPLAIGTLLATFTDVNPLSTLASFSGTVNWGDSASNFPVAIAASNVPGTYVVRSLGAHTFLEEGLYNVTVTINDVGGTTAISTSTATVADAALSATGIPVAATEGNAFTGQVAMFTDADPAGTATDYTVSINWGDGVSTPGMVAPLAGGGFGVTGAHTYKFGSFPITVSIADAGGSTATATSTAAVAGALLSPGAGAAISGMEGVPLHGVDAGTFTSANPLAIAGDFTASVNWGDGSLTSLGTIVQAPNGSFHVFASHTYAEETLPATPDTPVVTVKSTSGMTTTLNGTAAIADAPLLATALPVTSTEGTPSTLNVATVNDTNPNGTVADYTVAINWGDGTTSTGAAVTITRVGASSLGVVFGVSATHTYHGSGQFLITTTVTDVGGSTTSAISSAVVSAANLVGTAVPVTGSEGVPLVNVPVATFVDLGGPQSIGKYTATIDWGDGTPQSPGTISLGSDGMTFTVTGSHTYGESGVYPVQVTILAADGARTTVLTSSTIATVPVIITGNLDPDSDSGVSNGDKITNDTQPAFNGTSRPGSIINLLSNRDGVVALIGTGVTDAAGNWSIRTGFIPDGTYAISATSTDPNRPSAVTGPVAILGGTSGLPPLVIDTAGPVVTEAIFRRASGKIQIAFQDSGAGMTTSNVIDGADFNFHVYGRTTFPPNLITSINVIQSKGPNDPIVENLTINNGKKLRPGRYVLTVTSGGMTDTAGNALDGEFYGFFPSGNGRPGGDFQALLVSNHSFTFAAMPTSSRATPNNPMGTIPKGFKTSTQTLDSTEREKTIVPVKPANPASKSHKLHDAALARVTAKSAKRKHN